MNTINKTNYFSSKKVKTSLYFIILLKYILLLISIFISNYNLNLLFILSIL